jgi:plasmid stability protein
MKTLQVRHVPDETHAVLRKRAAEAGMSLQEFVLALLNDFAVRPTLAEVLSRAGRRAGGRVGLARAAAQLRTERDRR